MAIVPTMSGLGSADGTVDPWVVAGLGANTVVNRCIVAAIALSDTTKSVTVFSDDNPGSDIVFSLVAVLSVTGLRLELWATGPTASKDGATFLRADLTGLSPVAITLIEFSGVVSLGANGSANNTNADPTIALSTQDANNYIVAGFGTVGATLPTSKTGTLERTRNSAGTNPVVSSINYNTVASPGSVTNAITRAAVQWAAIALELRTAGAAPSSNRNRMMFGVG